MDSCCCRGQHCRRRKLTADAAANSTHVHRSPAAAVQPAAAAFIT